MGTLVSRAQRLVRETSQARGVPIPHDIRKLIGFEPRPVQAEILAAARRFNIRSLHRRAGKTVMELANLFEAAVENPLASPRYAYCAPTYAQVKDIAWVYLTAFHTKFCEGVGLKPDDWRSASDLSVTFPTRAGHKARIRLYGLDSPKQRIRGLYLDGVAMDEWAWIPPRAWTEQIRPMLADDTRAVVDATGRRNQWADFIFTPYGRNHAYTMFQKASLWSQGKATIEVDPVTGVGTEVRSDDWTAVIRRASETGIISREELAAIRADIGSAKFEQEFECSFDAAVEGAIYARELADLRAAGGVGPTPWVKHLPVHTAWDLGFDDATAIWFFQQIDRQINIIDYYEARQADLDHYVDVLAGKPYRYGRMLFPHDVDHQTLAGGGKSIREQLNMRGVRVTVVPKLRVQHGIAAVRALFPRFRFDDERTALGMDRLALYRRRYDEKLDVFSEAPTHDWSSHAADALRVLATGAKRDGDGQSDRRDHHAVV